MKRDFSDFIGILISIALKSTHSIRFDSIQISGGWAWVCVSMYKYTSEMQSNRFEPKSNSFAIRICFIKAVSAFVQNPESFSVESILSGIACISGNNEYNTCIQIEPECL